MAVKQLWPTPFQFVDANGAPYSGALLFFYAAGSSTKQNVYTDSGGGTAASNPITLNSSGYPAVSGTILAPWGTVGQSYKIGLAAPGASDPPASFIWTIDNVTPINDTTVTVDQWVSGPAPTYISATSFSLVGDQTATFQVGRRVKTTNSGGTIYSRISASAYGAVTTVTVVNDSGTLDAGLSAVSYGLMSATNPSTPLLTDAFPIISGSADKTKLVRLEVDGLTTATTRVVTVPDANGTMAYTSDITAIVRDNGTNDFRLTLTTALPVTTSDVTAATTIYCTPYKGNRIALYDGSTWNVRTSAEFSIAIGTLAAQRMHDVFVYDNAGTPTLELLIWTNDTTRATALTLQDGVLVKTGATTRRYVGSFYPTSTTQMADSMANRFLWNYYNRVDRPMRSALETADTWTYTLAAFQQANANTANQLNYVIGVDEEALEAVVIGSAQSSASGNIWSVGIGLDSTTAKATGCLCQAAEAASANEYAGTSAQWRGYTGAVGKHFLAWLEYSTASGTTTWAGDIGAPNFVQSGIVGMIRG